MHQKSQQLGVPPGPRGLPLVGSFLELRRDTLGFLDAAARAHGATVHLRFGPLNAVLIQRPEDVRRVLVQRHENYRKSPSYDLLRFVLGNGLLNSEGSFWRRQRKLMQPAFHMRSLVSFADTMAALSLELADDWGRRPGPLDVHAEMMRVTLRIVGHTLMSTELSGQAERLGRALGQVLDYAQSTDAMLSLPDWVPRPARRRAHRAVAELDEVVLALIAERRRQPEPGRDLLGMLLAATGDDGEGGMDDRQLRDEVMTLVLAGHETTANALAWTFALVAQHPAVEAELVAEVERVVGDGPVRFSHLPELRYTQMVLEESMRLYPPAWMIERQAIEDDELGGYRVPADWLVLISPWVIHRDPSLYPDPLAFDPQRFSEAGAAARPRYAYLPFGAGPRTCIGNSFALMEAKIVLATLIARTRLRLLPGQRLRPEPSITLRPRGGIAMHVAPR